MAVKIFKSFGKHSNRFTNGVVSKRNSSKLSCLKPELEIAFNNQINVEFFASFTYLAMAAFFGRQSISLPGCQKYFMDQVQDEREHAQILIDYVNKRGNNVCLQAIQPPANQTWDSPLAAFKEALELEKYVSEKIFTLHKISQEIEDLCACNILETVFLETQVEESDRLTRLVAQLEKIGPDGLGIYMFDRCLLKDNK